MTPKPKDTTESPAEDELQTLEPEDSPVDKKSISAIEIWNKILHFGLGESTLRIGTALASIVLIALVVWVMSKFFLKSELNNTAIATPVEDSSATAIPLIGDNIEPLLASSINVIRLAELHTILPPKPRNEVTEYEIQKGDTLFGIAERFGLKPESLMWSNKHILGDNPHNLFPGVTILIPPFDGAIYQWAENSGLNGVAEFYHISPDAIVDFPGNHLDRSTLGEYSFPNIPIGKLLFIPNGYGDFIDWVPSFTRETAAKAATLGPGSCGAILDGPIGNGTFVWPTTETWLSGFDYSPSTNHRGIDIAGDIGNPIYSVDAGVVVYSGENNNGYGLLLIIDHGNEWQSVYAHLNAIYKGCGDYISQGEQVAELGNTGNSTGAHLHFELRNLTYGIVNPWDFLH